MNPFIHALLAANQVTTTQVIDISMVSEDSLYWPEVHKSSDWSDLFTFTKDYFVLYSTVHDNGAGGLYWGEMDDREFNGFIERGLIKSGYQAETPSLLRVPTAESGIADEAFLFYHTLNEPGHNTGNGASNIQETRLITSSGGSTLHESTWNDQGRPFGLLSDEDHTGYARPKRRGVNDYVAPHLAKSGAHPDGSLARISTASNPLSWTRGKDIDRSAGVPSGGDVHPINIASFYYNGNNYAFVIHTNSQGNELVALVECDADFLPNNFIEDVYDFPGNLNNVMVHIEGSTAYVLMSEADQAPTAPYYQFEYDLSNL